MSEPRADVQTALERVLADAAPTGLVSAYLFGSHAAGRAHRDSDVDVGVLLDWAAFPTARERFEARVRLTSDLIAGLGRSRVDVVVLNDAPPGLGRRIVTEGRRVYCADPGADHAYVRDVQLRAADLEPFLRRMRRIKLDALGVDVPRRGPRRAAPPSRPSPCAPPPGDRPRGAPAGPLPAQRVRDERFPAALVRELEQLPGFRNVVIHEYVGLDMDRVVEALDRLEPVEKFLAIVRRIADQSSGRSARGRPGNSRSAKRSATTPRARGVGPMPPDTGHRRAVWLPPRSRQRIWRSSSRERALVTPAGDDRIWMPEFQGVVETR